MNDANEESMLVDDEEDVRQAIARKINWEEIGFQVVASAENGQEALELARTLRLAAFTYYLEMMRDVMLSDRSYDSLPNLSLIHI